MGLFWPKSSIDTPHRKLLGSRTRGGRAGGVNFWKQVGIYALFREFNLVYIGQAGTRGLGARLLEHKRGVFGERWDRFSWFGFGLVNQSRKLRAVPARFHVDQGVVLNHIEGILVEAAEPKLNGQGGKWKSAVTLYHPISENGNSEEAELA
jgi:hypothetical protein